MKTQLATKSVVLASMTALMTAVLLLPNAVWAQTLTWDNGGANPTNPVDGSGNWNTTTNAFWSNGSTDSLWVNGDIAQFGNGSGTGTYTVTINDLSGGVTAGGLNFNLSGTGSYNIAGAATTLTLSGATPIININGGGTDTISAILAGTIGFTLNGNGVTLALTNANTISGTINISSGSLLLQNAGAVQNATVSVGSTNGLLFNAGGTYNIAGLTSPSSSNVALSNGTGTQNVTLSVGGTNTTSAFTGALTDGGSGGQGSLTKVGTGTFTLSGQNTFSGPVGINGGLLVLNSGESGTSGPLGEGGSISFGGGALEYTGNNTTDYSSRFSTAASQGYSVNTNGQTVTWAANLTSSGGTLTKSGTGTLIITGANTYSGATTISAGTLQVGNGGAGSLGASAVTDNGTLAFNLSTPSTYTLSNTITGTGGLTQAGSNILLVNAVNTFSGATTLSSGTLQLGNSLALQNSTLTLNGGNVDLGSLTSVTLGGLAGSGGLNLQNDSLAPVNLTLSGNTASYSGQLGGTNVTVTKNGTGTQTFAGANTFTGTTIVNAGGLTLTATQTNTAFILNGGTLTVNAAQAAVATITLNGGTLAGSQALAATNFIFANSGTTSLTMQGASNTLSALFAGNANLTWNEATVSNVTINGTSSIFSNYGGTVTWANGNGLRIIGATGGGSSINPFANFDLGTTTGNISTRNGTSQVNLGGVQSTSATAVIGGSSNTGGRDDTWIVGSANLTQTFAGIIQEGTANTEFEKTGFGTLTLTGLSTANAIDNEGAPSTYNVSGGTLLLNYSTNTSNILAAAGSFGFAQGGTLSLLGHSSGTTTQAFSSTLVSAGGGTLIVNPNGGTSTTLSLGAMTVTPTAAQVPGSTLEIQPPSASIGAGTVSITTTTAVLADGTYGARFTYGSDWASTTTATPFVLSGYIGYNTLASGFAGGTDTANDQINSTTGSLALTSNYTTNSLKINPGSGQQLDLGGHSLSLTNGGLLFAGNNDYTIGVTAGSILSNATATNTDFIVHQLGTGKLTINATVSDIVVGAVTSAQTLTKAGAGTLVLTGANTYTGATFVNGGVLSVGTDSNIGGNNGTIGIASSLTTSATVTLSSATLPAGFGPGSNLLGRTVNSINGTTVTLNGNAGTALSNSTAAWISGATLNLDGATLQATNSFSMTESNTGGSAGTVSGSRAVVLGGGGGTFDVTGSNTLTVPGVVSDATLGGSAAANTSTYNMYGALIKTDTGTLTFTGTNTYTGATIINGGVLSTNLLANGNTNSGIGAAPSVAGALVLNGGTLQYTGPAVSTDRTFTVGTSGATLDGSGSGALTFANTAPIVANTAAAGSGARTFTLAGSTAGNIFAGQIVDGTGGATSLTKSGTGTWSITNPSHTYTGNTNINGGTLLLSAASTNPIPSSARINVASGILDVTGLTNSTINLGTQTLTGSGSVNGTVQAGASAIIVPGTLVTNTSQAGTLTTSNLVLASGSTLNFALSSANLDGGSLTGADLISTGTLTLPSSGGLTNFFIPGTTNQFATSGLYDLIHYTTLSGTLNSSTFSVANSNGAFSYTFGTSNNYLTLNIVQNAISANWNDGSISPNNNPGNWSNAANWSGGVPGTGAQGFGDSANFGSTTSAPASGAPVTNVVLDASEVVGGITFNNSSSYTISEPTGGGTNALTMNSGPSTAATIHVQSGSHAINVPLILFQASPSLATTVTVDNATSTLTIGGAISGSGSLTKAGAGTLVLTNAGNSYGSGAGGGTSFNGGVVVFNTPAELGSGSLLTFAGGTLRYNGNSDDISNKTITFNAGGGGIDTNGSTVQFANAIGNGGAGGFTKAGAGTLTLQANSTYTGGTTITGGTLAISTDTRIGPAPGTTATNLAFDPGTGNTATLQALGGFTLGATRTVVANSGTALIDTGTNTVIIAGAINGNGALEKAGTGTLTLQGTSNQSGGITVDAGTLNFQQPASINSPILLKNSTTLNLQANGSNSVFLGAANTTTIAAGATATLTSSSAGNGFNQSFAFGDATSVLDIGANVSLSAATQQFGASVGTVDILSTGGLRWGSTTLNDGGTQTTFIVDGAMTTRNQGAVALGALTGSGTVSGGNNGTTVTTYTIGAKNLSTTFSGSINDGATNPVAITVTGTGTLTLAGNNNYTQTTTINAGATLQIGDPTVNSGTSGTLGNGSVVNNSALVFKRSDSLTVNGAISGTGTLTQAGTGTTSLTGASTYSGATTVSAGTLALNNSTGSATGTSNITVGSSATISGSGFATGTATISSGGVLAPGNSGVGTLTLGGLNVTGTTLNYEFQGFGQANDLTNVTNSGGLTINAGTGMNVYQNGSTNPYLTNGVYQVFDYVGTLNGVGVSGLSVLNPDPSKSYAFSANGSQIFLTILPSQANAIYWNVNGSSTWNTNTHWSPNTIPNGAGVIAAFGGGGATLTTNATITVDAPETVGELSFNNSAFPSFTYHLIGSNTITLDGNSNTAVINDVAGSHSIAAPINLNSDLLINVVNAADTMTISSAISGGVSNFANGGAGTVILSGANSYSATNSINQGTVMLSGVGTLGSTGNNLNMNGGTLDLGTTSQTVGTVNMAGGNIVHGTLTPNGGVNFIGSGTATISSAIAGSGAIQVNGASTGTLVLSGANTFANSSITVTTGALSVSSENNLGDVSNSLNLNGGTFQVTGTTYHAFNASRSVSGYNSAFDIADAGNTFTITPGGNSGSGTLVKLGAGTLVVDGTVTPASFNGGTTTSVRAGTLEIKGSVTLANTANLGIEIAPSAGQTAAVVVDSGAVLNTERTIIGGNQANTDGGTGTLTVNSGTINSAQWFTVGSFGSGTSTATLNGASIVNVNSAATSTAGSGTQVEVADFGAASGVLNINGTSQLNILNSGLGGNGDLAMGVNTVSGNGTVNQNGGSVNFYSDGGFTLGGTGGLRLGKVSGDTGTYTYNLNGGQLNVPIITRTGGTGIFNFNGGTLSPTGASTTFMQGLSTAQVQAGGALINNAGFSITIGQALLHDATVGAPAIDGGLISSGIGTLTLTGTNTFTGNTTVSGGTLVAGSTGALENSVLTTGGTGFQFASTVASHAFSIGGLSGSNGLALADNAATPNNVTLSVGGVTVPVNSTYSGVLSGGGGLTKINAGSTFTLAAASSFTGRATITQGTLALSTANAMPDVSSVALSGGTLATDGLNQNMTLGATPAPLILSSSSSIDFGSGASTLSFAASNTQTWTGTLTINNWSGTAITGGGTDKLFVGSTNLGLTSGELADITFNGFAPGATILSNGEVVPTTAAALLGDINQDGHVDVRDIADLMLALANLSAYETEHPSLTPPQIATILDVNQDGKDNNADLQGLINYLIAGNGSTAPVPEPSSIILLGLGGAWLIKRRTRRA